MLLVSKKKIGGTIHFSEIIKLQIRLNLKNIVDYKNKRKKRNDVSVSSWHHYQSKECNREDNLYRK